MHAFYEEQRHAASQAQAAAQQVAARTSQQTTDLLERLIAQQATSAAAAATIVVHQQTYVLKEELKFTGRDSKVGFLDWVFRIEIFLKEKKLDSYVLGAKPTTPSVTQSGDSYSLLVNNLGAAHMLQSLRTCGVEQRDGVGLWRHLQTEYNRIDPAARVAALQALSSLAWQVSDTASISRDRVRDLRAELHRVGIPEDDSGMKVLMCSVLPDKYVAVKQVCMMSDDLTLTAVLDKQVDRIAELVKTSAGVGWLERDMSVMQSGRSHSPMRITLETPTHASPQAVWSSSLRTGRWRGTPNDKLSSPCRPPKRNTSLCIPRSSRCCIYVSCSENSSFRSWNPR